MKKRKATPRQRAFAEEYAKGTSATQAYLNAYAAGKKMSRTVASACADRLLKKAWLQECLDEILEDDKWHKQRIRRKVLDYVAESLEVSPTEAFHDKKKMKYVTEVTLKSTVDLSKLKGKERDEIGVVEKTYFPEKIKTFSKEKAIEILAKYSDMGMDKSTIDATIKTQTDPSNLKNLSDEEIDQLIALNRKAASDVQS